MGKLTSYKAKGPGLFFVLPCIDTVNVVDLRTITFDIPPQKVSLRDDFLEDVESFIDWMSFFFCFKDLDEG